MNGDKIKQQKGLTKDFDRFDQIFESYSDRLEASPIKQLGLECKQRICCLPSTFIIDFTKSSNFYVYIFMHVVIFIFFLLFKIDQMLQFQLGNSYTQKRSAGNPELTIASIISPVHGSIQQLKFFYYNCLITFPCYQAAQLQAQNKYITLSPFLISFYISIFILVGSYSLRLNIAGQPCLFFISFKVVYKFFAFKYYFSFIDYQCKRGVICQPFYLFENFYNSIYFDIYIQVLYCSVWVVFSMDQASTARDVGYEATGCIYVVFFLVLVVYAYCYFLTIACKYQCTLVTELVKIILAFSICQINLKLVLCVSGLILVYMEIVPGLRNCCYQCFVEYIHCESLRRMLLDVVVLKLVLSVFVGVLLM